MLVELSEKVVPVEGTLASPGRVLCLPANDEADEITAAMLAQLLEQAGYPAIALSLDPALQQAIGLLDPGELDTFCISALPPFAFARARALTRQLQSRFPRTKVMVGVWGFTGDAESAVTRFESSRPDKLATSLADAVKFVAETSGAPPLDQPVPAALTSD
jgi:methanogenic corrinoid protein MtbC1